MGNAKWVKIDDTVNLIGDNIEIRNCSSQYICNILNNQDEEIAELEEQLEVTEQLRQETLNEGLKVAERDSSKIKELQEQLKSQPKEIIEKIISKMDNVVDTLINCGNGKEDAIAWFCGILKEISKEYEGKDKNEM